MLLTQTITRNVQSYAGCQDQKVLSIILFLPPEGQRLPCDAVLK